MVVRNAVQAGDLPLGKLWAKIRLPRISGQRVSFAKVAIVRALLGLFIGGKSQNSTLESGMVCVRVCYHYRLF